MTEQPGNMVGLKALVIGLGFLIVVAFAVLVHRVFQKATDGEATPVVAPAVAGGKLPAFGDVRLPPQISGNLVDFRAVDGRLFLWIEESGQGRVVVVDLSDGRILGQIVHGPQ